MVLADEVSCSASESPLLTLPPLPTGTRSVYLKLRDRASYEFALASAAVVVTVNGGRIEHAHVALGGVGTRPWHALEAEAVLRGATPDAATFRKAAQAALANAKPHSQNGFKVELARRCIVHALGLATATA